MALSGFSPTYKNLVGQSSPYTGWLATFNIPSSTPGFFIGQLSFDSQKTSPFGVIPNGGAQAVFVVSAVPEPGAVAFGVLAAGSVLGLVARRRKMA